MRARTPLFLLALLAAAALAVLAPLSQATGSTPASTAKKKKKKKLKCKKGYVKKTVKKKKGKKTVSVKKCVKKKATPKPAPPTKAVTTYSGKTSQGLAITINRRASGTVSVVTQVTVNCGPNDDRTYDVSAIGVSPGGTFTVSDITAKSGGNSSRPVVVRGSTANGTATGTIEPKSSSQCPGGPPVSFQAKAK